MNIVRARAESRSIKKDEIPAGVSVNITTHSEGILAHKTLRSIYAGILYARARGVLIECNIAIDSGDVETIKTVNDFLSENSDLKASLYHVDVKDISLSRNFLVDQSRGKYIAFFDGDDFFTENYLYEAYTFAEMRDEPAVYSPRYLIVFEGDHYLVEKLDSESAVDVSKNLFEINYYIGQSFTHRDIYKKLKYHENSNGYGMEDWHFSCEVAALGYKFYNVPNTIFFYRRKKTGSLLMSNVQACTTIAPTKLFRAPIYSNLLSHGSINNIDQNPKTLIHKTNIKEAVVDIIRPHELLYQYLKTQYHLHKNIIKTMQQRLSNESRSVTPEPMTMLPPIVPARLHDIGFSPELVQFWGNINQFEPMIRSSRDMLENIPIVGYPETSPLSDLYYKFCQKYKDTIVTDVVLVPHLVRGGADLTAINLIKELAKNNNVLVITTVDVLSPWLDKVSGLNNVICLESKVDFVDLDEEKRILFILRIIQHWGTKRLSIINSEVGYKIATKYGQVLKAVGCTTYLYTYAYDMTDDGYIHNWISNGLVDAYRGVDFYVTDSMAYKNQLMRINGFADEKVIPLYSPISVEVQSKQSYSLKRKVLWASRVHSSKLVEVMVEVGRQLTQHNVELHVFGDIDAEYALDDRFANTIAPYKNIVYEGSYEGFGTIDTNGYDMYLLTSKNEGMPLVILEAIMANIFIIAPSVGGIPECITQHGNGMLVENKLEASSYTAAILEAYEQEYFKDQQSIKNVNDIIIKRHSLSHYTKQVKNITTLTANRD